MIIAIDPDVKASGLAIIYRKENIAKIRVFNLPLWELFSYIKTYAELVLIEAGWLNKKGLSFKGGPKEAIDLGRNHAIGEQIERFCKAYGIEYQLIRPTHAKWTHKEFVTLTGSPINRTNQEQRDAASLIFYNTEARFIK